MGRVTIKSIAKDLGVSHMTVSRALSGHPNVLEKTRKVIQARARELGYVKSTVALAMRGDGPRIVGLLLPNIVNEFYARFANAMSLACDANALQLIIHLTNDDFETEELALARLLEVNASAVVLVPAPGQVDTSTPNYGSMRVIELIRQRDTTQAHPSIMVEDATAIRAAVQHLVDQGHSNIAYIGANQALSSGRLRLEAFLGGADEAGLTSDATQMRTGPPSFQMAQGHARDILESGRSTALVCGGVEISNGALSAFMSHPKRTAENFAFVGYGDPSFYAWVNGGITTIQVPVLQLAKSAIELIEMADINDSIPRVSFPASLVIR